MRRMRSNTENPEPIPSRVQSTAMFSRKVRPAGSGYLGALAEKVEVEVYDSVRAANEAGFPMPAEVDIR